MGTIEERIEALYLAYENNTEIRSIVTENNVEITNISILEKIQLDNSKTHFLGRDTAGNRICIEIAKRTNELRLKIERGPKKAKNQIIDKLYIGPITNN